MSIEEHGFVSLFQHHDNHSEQEFFGRLQGRSPVESKTALIDGEEAQLEYSNALAKGSLEKDLQKFVMDRLDSIENVSTRVLLNYQKENKEAEGPNKKKKSEAALKTVFVKYAEKMQDANVFRPTTSSWENYPKDPRGCLVTVASRQDAACLNSNSWRLFQGEFKNDSKYSIMDGIRQCVGYLWHQLWWFRTVQGLGVEQVYGFVICGPKCRDVENKVVVSLLVLSQCAKIGDKFDLYEYRQSYDVDDLTAFDSLKLFVESQFEIKPASARRIPSDRICPGIMMIPQHLLFGADRVWNIVKSRTAALIFRVKVDEQNKEDVQRFLAELALTPIEQRELLGCVKQIISTKNNATFYLKIKTLATGKTWKENAFDLVRAVGKAKSLQCPYLQEWGQTYTSTPSFESGGGIIILMHDAGSPLHRLSDKPPFQSFCREFLSLMRSILTIQEHLNLVHGDIHEGNLLFNAQAKDLFKLRLIDWDESGKLPMKRMVTNEMQKERYPEQLLKSKEAYTKAQLILLFRDVSMNEYSKAVFAAGRKICLCDQSSRNWMRLSLLNTDEDSVSKLYSWLEVALLEVVTDSELESTIEELAALVIEPLDLYVTPSDIDFNNDHKNYHQQYARRGSAGTQTRQNSPLPEMPVSFHAHHVDAGTVEALDESAATLPFLARRG